jgi:hypothetical protein
MKAIRFRFITVLSRNEEYPGHLMFPDLYTKNRDIAMRGS